MSEFKVWSKDYRHDISDAADGSYFVQKKNIIAQFGWGASGSFACASDAHKSMTEYLANRKDSASLFVNLLEFGN